MAKQSAVDKLRVVAQLNADTAKGLQTENGRLRLDLAGAETRLREIARLAAAREDGYQPLPIAIDAVYVLTLGLVSRSAQRLRKIASDSKNGAALRGAIAATASFITHAREVQADEGVEQLALDALDTLISEIVATIPD
jgi:hypothetical protein